MFYIHGNIILNGDWPDDAVQKVEGLFKSQWFEKTFGRDSVLGDSSGSVYIVMGRGCLVPSDLFDAAAFFSGRWRAGFGQVYEDLMEMMCERKLSIAVRTSSHDIHLSSPSDGYTHDVLITSDGRDFVIDSSGDGEDRVCDSLDGYSLTRLCEIAVRALCDLDFYELDASVRPGIRCGVYFDVTGHDFFNDCLMVLRMSHADEFESKLDSYLTRFFDAHVHDIEAVLSSLGVFVK